MNTSALRGEGSGEDVMIRVGLIAYLMLVTLAGPAWCCCTLDALPLPTFATEEAVKPNPVRTCCQHRSKPQKEKSSHPTKKQEPNAPGHSCPCKESGSNQALATSLDIQSVKQLWSHSQALERDQLLADSYALSGNASLVSSVCSDSSRTFHLSGPALLCALQVYRC